MKTEDSLPHSPVPAACPYPERHGSSPCPHIPIPEDPSEYYLRIYAWIFQVVTFPWVFPPKPFIHFNPPPCYISRPSLSSQFDPLNDVVWAVYIIKLRIMSLSPFHHYFLPLRPKYSHQHPVLKHPQPPSFNPHKTTGKMIFLYIFIFKFLDNTLEDKDFYTEW